jgi:papain like cysteine protease AvrRpt2
MVYIVPGMKLITQDKTMSCWFASGQMIIEWRRRTRRMTEAAHPAPDQVERWKKLYRDNPGISNGQITAFARDLGLKMVPPMSPTAQAIRSWLQVYGPLWVNGVAHITVIAGIRDDRGLVEVLVYDPARADRPAGEWRALGQWYFRDPHSGRDTARTVDTVFLYAPAD